MTTDTTSLPTTSVDLSVNLSNPPPTTTTSATKTPISSQSTSTRKPAKPSVCRFFNTKGGCKAGAECRFRHLPPKQGAPVADDAAVENLNKFENHNNGAKDTVDVASTSAPKKDSPRRRSSRAKPGPDEKRALDSNTTREESVTPSGLKVEYHKPAEATTPSGLKIEYNRPAPKDAESKQRIDKRDHKPKAAASREQLKPAETSTSKPPSSNSDTAPVDKDSPSSAKLRPAARPPVARPQPKSLETRLQETSDPLERAHLTRTLELQQLERRFTPTGHRTISTDTKQTTIQIGIVPSDPDFPFDLESLRLHIVVPSTYPITPSQIRVLNKEIPEAIARGVEKAWERKASAVKLPLLNMLNWLDRNLEELLGKVPEPSVSISFVSNAPREGGGGGGEGSGRTVQQPELTGGVVHRKDRDDDKAFYYGIPVGGGGDE
ncbi:hypothetical protein HK097_001263, partial [Rhizophlyctis rosea]